ncbi:MAG TPA: glycosyltransferase family 2 protein [Thermoleophilaceae bacterium]
MPAELAAVVAAHNEEQRLGETLVALRSAFPGARLIVADDASTDRTPEIAREAGAELVRSERRLGKGGANTPAAENAVSSDPVAVLLCDGDLGASAAQLKKLVHPVVGGEADLAIAKFARRVGGGFGIAVGSSRRVVEKRAGLRLEAPLSGQRALTPQALRAVLPFARGFGMETAMDIDAVRAGLSVVEIELELEHRATGRSAAGFAHRGRQLLDIGRVYVSRR